MKSDQRRVISLLVDNQSGVLARVSSLFCRRGFNIDSLTVSATNDPAVSRITVTITSDEKALQQLVLQTERLEVTRQVFVLDSEKALERELLLLKVESDVHNRTELREIACIYKAKIIDLSPDSMVFELIGKPEKIDAFLKMFEDYKILELCRTGEGIKDKYDFIADVANKGDEGRIYLLEGYLYPDTYEIYVGSSEETIIGKMLDRMNVIYGAGYTSRAEELNMSMDQVITLASIIEKEGKHDTFDKVSAVFHNRLDQKMALGSDVTVQYALGVKRLVLTQSELGVDSPYDYIGRDAFDPTYEGYALFSDGSWISGDIAYDAGTKRVLSITGGEAEASSETLDAMAQKVQQFVRINNLILDTDYYKDNTAAN